MQRGRVVVAHRRLCEHLHVVAVALAEIRIESPVADSQLTTVRDRNDRTFARAAGAQLE